MEEELAELRQALGLLTTLVPDMVMDSEHPLDMAKRIESEVRFAVRFAQSFYDLEYYELHGAGKLEAYAKHFYAMRDYVNHRKK
jgi:hypothetical protein